MFKHGISLDNYQLIDPRQNYSIVLFLLYINGMLQSDWLSYRT